MGIGASTNASSLLPQPTNDALRLLPRILEFGEAVTASFRAGREQGRRALVIEHHRIDPSGLHSEGKQVTGIMAADPSGTETSVALVT